MREARRVDARAPPDEGESRLTLNTRHLSGVPSWPIILLAGMHSTGKTFTCVEASASPLIARTLWLGFGELDPDDYGSIPGSAVETVHHNGTVHGLTEKVNEIADLPDPEHGVNLIVIDSGTPVWESLTAGVQRAKVARGRDADNDKELWDAARAEWRALLAALRRHRGPSIITARFEETAIYVGDQATGERPWQVKAEKSLAYEVGAVIEMRTRGDYVLAGVKSASMQFNGPREWPDFTVDALWREMGLQGAVGDRVFAEPVTDPDGALDVSDRDWFAELKSTTTPAAVAALGADASRSKANRDVVAAIRKKSRQTTTK